MISQRTRRRLIALLFSILLTILLIEFPLLRWGDPLGIYAYFDAQNRLLPLVRPSPGGFRLVSGRHDIGYFTVTVTPEGYRAVPTSAVTGECVLAFVGDSLTFGLGVEDSETYAAQLALQLPQVRIINAGRNGYEAGNVAALIETTPARGYVWLVSANDVQPAREVTVIHYTYQAPPAIGTYIRALAQRPALSPDYDEFRAVLQRLSRREDVLMVTLPHQLQGVAQLYGAIPIPAYTETISVYDNHPSPAGHQQLTSAMHPHVQSFVRDRCE